MAASDEHRRRLERDLHDGAQQRLLAVTYQLRLARAEALAAGRYEAAGELEDLGELATEALDELRSFAHGVFPAVLDEAGLEEALASIGDRSRVPADVECRLEVFMCGPAAQRAAYLFAKTVVESSEDGASLEAFVADGNLVLVATGVGCLDGVHLADRLGAAGGSVSRAGDRMEAVIPCGS